MCDKGEAERHRALAEKWARELVAERREELCKRFGQSKPMSLSRSDEYLRMLDDAKIDYAFNITSEHCIGWFQEGDVDWTEHGEHEKAEALNRLNRRAVRWEAGKRWDIALNEAANTLARYICWREGLPEGWGTLEYTEGKPWLRYGSGTVVMGSVQLSDVDVCLITGGGDSCGGVTAWEAKAGRFPNKYEGELFMSVTVNPRVVLRPRDFAKPALARDEAGCAKPRAAHPEAGTNTVDPLTRYMACELLREEVVQMLAAAWLDVEEYFVGKENEGCRELSSPLFPNAGVLHRGWHRQKTEDVYSLDDRGELAGWVARNRFEVEAYIAANAADFGKWCVRELGELPDGIMQDVFRMPPRLTSPQLYRYDAKAVREGVAEIGGDDVLEGFKRLLLEAPEEGRPEPPCDEPPEDAR